MKSIETELDETIGTIIVLEEEIIPDLKERLEWLTSPDYNPEDNPDHDLREHDIEFGESELAKEEGALECAKKRFERLERLLKKRKEGT